MTPKQITIFVFIGFILSILFIAIVFAIYRYIRPPDIDPTHLLYIVKPGLNYGNQLGMMFVVICIVGFFLTFYIPVINNWNKEKCNDGMMFLAPLFDKDANDTLKECANQTLEQNKLPTNMSYSLPVSLSNQIQWTLNFFNSKINEIQALLSTKADTVVTQQMRDKLRNVANGHNQIRRYEDLKNLIAAKTQEINNLKSILDSKSLLRRNADRARNRVQYRIDSKKNRGHTISPYENSILTSHITSQTNAQQTERDAQQKFDTANNQLTSLRNEFGGMNPWWMKMVLDWRITDARNTIK